MVLRLSSVGLISMLLLPAIFLLVLRVLRFSTDPLGLILSLILSEGLSLLFALVLVIHFKIKARVPVPKT